MTKHLLGQRIIEILVRKLLIICVNEKKIVSLQAHFVEWRRKVLSY